MKSVKPFSREAMTKENRGSFLYIQIILYTQILHSVNFRSKRSRLKLSVYIFYMPFQPKLRIASLFYALLAMLSMVVPKILRFPKALGPILGLYGKTQVRILRVTVKNIKFPVFLNTNEAYSLHSVFIDRSYCS